MNTEQSLAQFGLVPTDTALPLIRDLPAAEAETERNGGRREEDLALLCCVQLFSRGILEDILRIWAAKQSGMDLSCYLDVQFLCGAGLTATKAFLAAQPGDLAADALEYIEACEAAGDFYEFSPDAHLQIYKNYFSVA